MGAANFGDVLPQSEVPTVKAPAAPPPVDAFGQLVAGVKASQLTSAARRGLNSTFAMGPAAPSALSSAYGAPGGSALGGVY